MNCEWNTRAVRREKKELRKVLNRRFTAGLSAVAILAGIVAMGVPARAADTQAECGFDEHIHNVLCYEESVRELVCTLQETDGHAHGETCYEQTVTYSCGLVEEEAHLEHTSECYGEKVQVCTLEENEEHTHSEDCYGQNLICGKDITEGHTHDETCEMQTESILICEQEEAEAHVHTAECYAVAEAATEENLICEKEAHRHSDACYLTVAALDPISLSGNWAADTLAIAQSYFNNGYTQETDADGNPYTVFGEYYNDAANTDWNAYFISYCIDKANENQILVPVASAADDWQTSLKEVGLYAEKNSGYTPVAGDLVFWQNYWPTTQCVGILQSVTDGGWTKNITVITADDGGMNCDGRVASFDTNINDGRILGYARIPNRDGTLEQTVNAKVYTDSTYTVEDTSVTAVVKGTLPVNAEIRISPLTLTEEQRTELSFVGEPQAAYCVKVFVNGVEYTGTIEETASIQMTSDSFGGDMALMPYRLQESQEPVKMEGSSSGNTMTLESTIPVDFAMVGISSIEVTTAEELKSAVESGIPQITIGADIVVDAGNDDIQVQKSVKIFLNGKTVTASGDNSLFVINQGGTLGVDDFEENDLRATISSVSDGYIGVPESVGAARLGTVSPADNGKATLTYYTTVSSDAVPSVQYDNGATIETRYKHTVTAKGMIYGNESQPIFTVKNGTLTISGGTYCGSTSGTATGRAIVQNSGTTNLNGGYICGFNVKDDVGGAVYCAGGQLNIAEYKVGDLTVYPVIAANKALSGAGIYASSTKIEMTGGVISGNEATAYSDPTINSNSGPYIGGGAIYLAEGSGFSMRGKNSFVSNNSAPQANGYSDGGGAIYARHYTEIIINGGYITSNTTGGGGGAIRTMYKHEGGNCISVIINGGYICGNFCQYAEGGGISIHKNTSGYVYGGYINNNATGTERDWGGGGIFNAEGSYLELKNVLITENHAMGLGGGIGGCSTGDIHLAVTEGGALFDNTAGAQKWSGEGSEKREDQEFAKDNPNFNLYCANDYFCVHNSKVEPQMLGRGSADWVGTVDDEFVTPPHATALEAHTVMGLNANPMDPGKMEARMNAKGYINGNLSNVHGGGIMCNGILDVGVPLGDDMIAYMSLSGEKSFSDENGSKIPMSIGQFEFEVYNDFDELVAKGKNDADGNISFDRDLLFLMPRTYTFRIVEKDLKQEGVSYDPTSYVLTVVTTEIPASEGVSANMEITSATVSMNGKEPIVVDINDSHAPTYSLKDFKFTFSNSFTDDASDTTKISVVKEWVDEGYESKRPQSITVNLLQNGTVYQSAILTADNWSLTWDELPKQDEDGKLYGYTVQEVAVDGYISNVTAIDGGFKITNTYNLTSINVKKVWNDTGYENLRSDSITAVLMQNEKEYSRKVLNAANNWQDSWTDLPVKDAEGNHHSYTVTENVPLGYTALIETTGSNVVITNTIRTTSVDVKKEWHDNDNAAGERPTSIVVELYQNGLRIKTDWLKASDNWKLKWEGLPLLDKAGEPFQYSVKEANVPDGYVSKVETSDDSTSFVTKFVITNTWESTHGTTEATTEGETETTTAPTTEETTTVTTSEETTKSSEGWEESKDVTISVSSNKVPQTGHLKWLVLIFAFTGIALIILGWQIDKQNKRRHKGKYRR